MNRADPVRRYLGEVRARLPMRLREKRRVMKQLTVRVSEYTYAFPETGYEELQERFGTPEEVSAMYVESRDPEELSRALHLQQRIWKLVVSAAAALVLLAALVSGYVMWRVHNASESYVVITLPQKNQSILDTDAPVPDLNEILAQA